MDFRNLRKKRTQDPVMKCNIQEARFVVLDSELTGLDEKKDSIVSIGAVRMRGGRIELGDSFYRLINPETSLTAASVVIHEIMPSEVSEKPSIETVLAEFLKYCGDAVLVGFCISIDMDFLSRETRRLFGSCISNPAIDIRPLYEWARQKEEQRGSSAALPRQYRLYDVARHFDIQVSSAHNAMVDAYLTAQIFQRLIPILVEAGITSIGDLTKLSDRLKGGDWLFASHNTCSL